MTLRVAVSAALLMGLSALAVAEDAPAPLPPAEAVATMSLPAGFNATVFAAEPDVVQPMAFTFDDRGRLWVVECLSYPRWETEGKPGTDRITIFEDKDGDGRFDSRKVFFDQGTNFTGIEWGFGGVWVTATPYLLFIPDANGDDRPDGKPRVLLDGWDCQTSKHNVVNGLTWGPDGWLYGCNGILSISNVGKPGTPEKARTDINCGVWRYHPTQHRFEVVADGTTNPWGLDFDAHGQMFITNCVIKHLFHVIPGGHYERMFGQDFNPHLYGLMESCADHIHWGGGKWTESRGGQGKHDKPGGGHAHVGAMIYLGDNWPDTYRGSVFTCNLHGRRLNRDVFKRRGSGVVAQHATDFLKVADPWFRGLELKYGPDGGVYMTDWSDTGECHDYDEIHRENGRIYKITYGKTKPVTVDLAKLSDRQLIGLLLHKNEWYVRHARRILQERAAAGTLSTEFPEVLWATFRVRRDHRLKMLWTLHVTGQVTEDEFPSILEAGKDDPFLRGWAIQMVLEDRSASAQTLAKLSELARSDPSPVVRLYLAAALQRLPIKQRWEIAGGLVAHAEDADDPNLPLMIWYGIEPAVADDGNRALQLVVKTKIPLIRQHIVRRLAAGAK